jgi:6-phosphogluconolactonase
MGHHQRQIFVLEDENRLSDTMIEIWRKICREAIAKNGYFATALSGGKTPIPLYRKLADLKDSLPWKQTHIFLVDERFVPLEDPDNNFHMLRGALLNRIRIPSGNKQTWASRHFDYKDDGLTRYPK